LVENNSKTSVRNGEMGILKGELKICI